MGADATRASPSAAAADARLRRASTAPTPYSAGQPYAVVRVPQRLAGIIDVGHISLLVGFSSQTLASVGFYAKGYRAGLPMVSSDAGVLVTPDPLYARAQADPTLREQITELHRGTLTAAQATLLNAWTDDAQGALTLKQFTTSAGKERELGISQLDGERYVALASFIPGASNCATFVERHFPGTIACPLGIPRLCSSSASGRQPVPGGA